MGARIDTRGKRQRSLKRKLFYSAIPTILAFLIVEGLFRLYVLVLDHDASQKRYEAMSNLPAYASKPWFSHEFAASLVGEGPVLYTPKGTRLALPMDCKDQFFTFRDGFRATVGFDPGGLPAGHRPRKLFLLGGSTTFCQEVPDALTYASQLQERLASVPETRDIEVVNCGIPSVVSLEEVERLEYELGRNNIPDFCVFFDGINDAHQGVVNEDPGGTVREVQRKYTDTNLLSTMKRMARVSVAARMVYHSILGSQRKNELIQNHSEAKMRELAQATADGYERNMLRAKEICDRYHIRMFVFLQPHVFSISGRPWTADERAAVGRTKKSFGDALRVCYPLLREKLGLLRQRGIMAYDISDAFDGNLEPIFVDDMFHVESTGNRLIAEAILKDALPILKGSSTFLQTALPVEPDRRTER